MGCSGFSMHRLLSATFLLFLFLGNVDVAVAKRKGKKKNLRSGSAFASGLEETNTSGLLLEETNTTGNEQDAIDLPSEKDSVPVEDKTSLGGEPLGGELEIGDEYAEEEANIGSLSDIMPADEKDSDLEELPPLEEAPPYSDNGMEQTSNLDANLDEALSVEEVSTDGDVEDTNDVDSSLDQSIEELPTTDDDEIEETNGLDGELEELPALEELPSASDGDTEAEKDATVDEAPSAGPDSVDEEDGTNEEEDDVSSDGDEDSNDESMVQDMPFVETQNVKVEGLPFGDINVLVVTDVHSHIAGHKHEKNRNADYGDILSFYQHLKSYCDSNDHDLWFVNNGNWKDGTGLAMGGNASSLVPLLNQMPWDAINIGEHELYHHRTVELMRESMIPNFSQQFVSSNVHFVSKNETKHMVNNYIVLKGKKHNVLVFGFLRDIHLKNPRLQIESVEKVIREAWFENALHTETYDAIMVLAQIDAEDGLITLISDKIRALDVGLDIPIQFIAGHTQKRQHKRVDEWSHSFQAGANLDTLGFVSFPVNATAKAKPKEAKSLFEFAYLNTSAYSLNHILGDLETFRTELGQNLSQSIQDTRHFLGLDEVVACPIQDYHLENHILRKQSLWGLWRKQVVPNEICKDRKFCIVLVSSTSFRYGVRGSASSGDEMTLDDVVAIAPLLEPVYHIGKVNDYAIQRMNSSLNIDSNQHHHTLPSYVMAGEIEERGDYDLYTHERDLPVILAELERLFVKDIEPKTTGDKDTLYWLRYAQDTWICPGKEKNEKIKPWFQNEKALELEKDDVIDLDDEDVEEDEEEEWVPPDDGVYYGWTPGGEHEIKHPGEGEGDKPKGPTSSQLLQQRAEAAKRKREKNAKARKHALNIAGVIFGIIVLCVPLYYIGKTIVGEEEEQEDFYDRKELKKFKKNKLKPMQIELT